MKYTVHKFQNTRLARTGRDMVEAAQTPPVLDSSSVIPVLTVTRQIPLHSYVRVREKVHCKCTVQCTVLRNFGGGGSTPNIAHPLVRYCVLSARNVTLCDKALNVTF
jgi:hypothetical protein